MLLTVLQTVTLVLTTLQQAVLLELVTVWFIEDLRSGRFGSVFLNVPVLSLAYSEAKHGAGMVLAALGKIICLVQS